MSFRLILGLIFAFEMISGTSAVQAQVCQVFFDVTCEEVTGITSKTCADYGCIPVAINTWACASDLAEKVLPNNVKAFRAANPGESGYTFWTDGNSVVCTVLQVCHCDDYDPVENNKCEQAGGDTDNRIFTDAEPVLSTFCSVPQ